MSETARYILKITATVVAVMSGPLAIFRESMAIFSPEKAPARSLLWSCVILAYIFSAAILWFLEHQKAQKNKPKLNAEFDVFSVAPAGEKDENTIVVINAVITNTGAPSIINKIAVEVKIGDANNEGQILHLPEKGMVIRGEGHSFVLKSEDHLPRLGMSRPIVTGGGISGFLILLFSGVNKETFNKRGTLVVLTFKDVLGKRYRYQTTMTGEKAAIPDIHKLQKPPKDTSLLDDLEE